MIKKFMSFFNKDGFNYSEGLVDPFEFHKTFYKVLIYFSVADVEYKPIYKICHNGFIFAIGMVVITMGSMSLYHGWDTFNIPFITETGTYVILTCYQNIIIYCTKGNLSQYRSLLAAMKDDFYYICTDAVGTKYRKKYFENQILTWKVCVASTIIMGSSAILVIIFTITVLIWFMMTHDSDDDEMRPLLFPIWLMDVDLGKSPYYEIAFIYSTISVACFAYTHVFMMQTQIVWIRHLMSKADVIIWNINDILHGVHLANNRIEEEYFSNLIITRMREIVIHHQDMLRNMKEFAAVYKKLLLYEQKGCWPVICLSAYSTLKNFEKGEFQVILAVVCVITTIMLFIPCYLCTLLGDKLSSIGDACYNIAFWNTGPVIRPYIVLLIQRSQCPLPLQAAGFDSVSLETFSAKMSAAYSLFNMLNQINLE